MKSKYESDEKEWIRQLQDVRTQNDAKQETIIKLEEQIMKLKEENQALRISQAQEIRKAEEKVRKEFAKEQ